MDINIREIEEQDYLSLLVLWREFSGTDITVENIKQRYNRIKDDKNYKTFVALYKNEIVGFVTSVQTYGIGVDGNYMQIIVLAVKTAMQKKGIGTKLMCHVETYAKNNGVVHIFLCSDFKRTTAHAFYEHIGYNKGAYCFGKSIQ